MDWRFIGRSVILSLLVAFGFAYAVESAAMWWSGEIVGAPRPFDWRTVWEWVSFLEMLFVLLFLIPYMGKAYRRNRARR